MYILTGMHAVTEGFYAWSYDQIASRNGIKHLRITSYCPSPNGQIERAVQTFKLRMKKELANYTVQSNCHVF